MGDVRLDLERFLDELPADSALRPIIEASWRRCRSARLDPQNTPLHRIDDESLERRLSANQQLVSLAWPQLEWVSTMLAGVGHVVYLVDRDGVVLISRSTDPELMRGAGLEPGYEWSEQRMGTNGAGTALAIEEPVTVIGGEHFVEAFRECICTAAPLRDANGDVIAAIDITTANVPGAAERLAMATHAARVIEQEILLREALERAHDETRERARVEGELRHAVDQSRRLQTLTAALSEAVSPMNVAEVVVREVTSALEAQGTVITRVTADGAWIEIMQAGAMPDDLRTTWQRFPLDTPVPLAESAYRGQAIYIESAADWDARYPHLAGMPESLGQEALMVIPLVVEARTIGSLGIAFTEAKAFSEADRMFSLLVARQCAQALERARLFEAEQRARAEAEDANRAKSDMLTAVSHDLRTPLNAIGGYVDLLQLGVRGPITEEQQLDLERIKRNQRQLLMLVEDLLGFAKIQAGQVTFVIQPVPVDDAIVAVESMIAPLAREHGLEFEIEPADEASIVLADPERLQQVLLNLVGNAIKFTPAGGRIRVGRTSSPRSVGLSVSDTGPGIPGDKLEAIFQPFVRLEANTGSQRPGTGLGLAISRRLARAMGGEVTATSEVGRGSTFVLTLPRP